MLLIPDSGVSRSVNKHNADPLVICDWIEASVFFSEEDLSVNDVVDVLLDFEIYAQQDLAEEMVNAAWARLERRAAQHSYGGCIAIDGVRLIRLTDWAKAPADAFCNILSISMNYSWWYRAFGADYVVQGELFEKLTALSIAAQMPGWKVYRTGWSASQPTRIEQLIDMICEKLSETPPGKSELLQDQDKEFGLDLFVMRPFEDGAVGVPYFLFQCASGADFERKFDTPNLNLWRRFLNPTVLPFRAFATPRYFDPTGFKRHATRVGGLFFDRGRILEASRWRSTWSQELCKDLIDWCLPRIEEMRRRSV